MITVHVVMSSLITPSDSEITLFGSKTTHQQRTLVTYCQPRFEERRCRTPRAVTAELSLGDLSWHAPNISKCEGFIFPRMLFITREQRSSSTVKITQNNRRISYTLWRAQRRTHRPTSDQVCYWGDVRSDKIHTFSGRGSFAHNDPKREKFNLFQFIK